MSSPCGAIVVSLCYSSNFVARAGASNNIVLHNQAGIVELVNTIGLGPMASSRAGSSPAIRICFNQVFCALLVGFGNQPKVHKGFSFKCLLACKT